MFHCLKSRRFRVPPTYIDRSRRTGPPDIFADNRWITDGEPPDKREAAERPGGNRGERMKIVIPDDYQDMIHRLDAFRLLAGHEVTRYRVPARDLDELVERLHPAECVV